MAKSSAQDMDGNDSNTLDAKRFKTSNQLVNKSDAQDITQSTSNSSAIKRYHVMNDDILGLILNEISDPQHLLRLETVCNQFVDCVGSALQKRYNGVIIAKYCDYPDRDDIWDIGGHTGCDLTDSPQPLDPMLKSFSHIKSFYIKECTVDEEALEVITTRCPQLTDVLLVDIKLDLCWTGVEQLRRSVHTFMQLISRLPRLKSLTIGQFEYRPNNKWFEFGSLSGHTLSLFTELNVLRVLEYDIEELVDFCVHLVANRQSKHKFTLELMDKSYCNALMARLRSTIHTIPKYFCVKKVTNFDYI